MKYNKTVLKNGLRLITVPMKNNPTVTVLVLVEAGSKYETKKKNGISHFLEHMCFKGTVKRPNNFDICTELDNLGAHYNAFTGQEFTGYYAKVEHKYLPKALDVVSDMFLNPIFDEKEMEKEKGVIIEEINMYEDLPQRKVEEVFEELLYGDQPAGWSIAGSKDNIRKMKREDFVEYRNNFYVPAATTVVIAGNFNEQKTIADVADIFGHLKKIKKGVKLVTLEKQNRPAIKIFKKDTDQAHLILGVRTFPTYDKRNSVLEVIQGILGGGLSSRLFKKLRDEMGICYYVRANKNTTTDCGTLTVSAGVNVSRVGEAIQAILGELRRLKAELISPEELNKVKQHLIGSMALGLESSDSLAEFFGGQEILNKPLNTADEIRQKIEKVTAADIMKLAQEIFTNRALNLAIVGKFENKAEFDNLLKF